MTRTPDREERSRRAGSPEPSRRSRRTFAGDAQSRLEPAARGRRSRPCCEKAASARSELAPMPTFRCAFDRRVRVVRRSDKQRSGSPAVPRPNDRPQATIVLTTGRTAMRRQARPGSGARTPSVACCAARTAGSRPGWNRFTTPALPPSTSLSHSRPAGSAGVLLNGLATGSATRVRASKPRRSSPGMPRRPGLGPAPRRAGASTRASAPARARLSRSRDWPCLSAAACSR
jgi:hypothetical protein